MHKFFKSEYASEFITRNENEINIHQQSCNGFTFQYVNNEQSTLD